MLLKQFLFIQLLPFTMIMRSKFGDIGSPCSEIPVKEGESLAFHGWLRT